VVHLPSDIAWSRSIGVEISTDQAEAALALCQVRVSGVSGPLVSSFGPINTLQPQLYTHKVLTSMVSSTVSTIEFVPFEAPIV
jgi:hypothetical protein